MDISAYVGQQVLNQVKLFDCLDDETIGYISLQMKSVSCNAGYKLFKTNDLGSEMFVFISFHYLHTTFVFFFVFNH